MSWFTRLFNSARGERLSRDLDREMHFHLQEKEDALVARGMTPAAAEREARRRFGNYGGQKERTRDANLFTWLDSVLGDVRYAVRSLRASPGFTIVAVLSLALGIGANTAIFSLINAVMLKSLPVQKPEQLVMLSYGGPDASILTNPIWEAVRDRQDVFSGTFAYGGRSANLAEGGLAHRENGDWVSGEIFTTLGVRAEVGRLLMRSDDHRGCPAVVAISYSLWQREFGGDPGVVGNALRLDGTPHEIVGVVDRRFFGMDVASQSQFYTPLCTMALTPGTDWLDARSTWFLRIVGRPKPELTPGQVDARLATLSPEIFQSTKPSGWPRESVDNYLKRSLHVAPAANGASQLRRQYKPALIALLVIVGMVLLIACANVANLMLARARARQHEIAVRIAIGAGRARIARQLLVESLLLAMTGAALGVLFARWGSRLLVTFLSTSSNSVSLDLTVDVRVLLFTVVVATATGILFGIVPAWRATHVDPQQAIKAGSSRIAEGHTRFAMGKALVVAQVALSLILVTAGGLLLGSFRALLTLDPGFRSTNVLLVAADMRGEHHAKGDELAAQRRVLDRLRAAPGVRSASTAILTPVGQSAWNEVAVVDGFVPKSLDDSDLYINEVSDGYFATLSVPMLTGRDFDARDVASAPKVAVVNETMAKRFFPGKNAVGRTFRTKQGDGFGPPIEIIGVTRDTKYRSLRDDIPATAFLARSQKGEDDPFVTYVVRGDGVATDFSASVKSVFADASPKATLDLKLLQTQVNESLTQERLLASLSGFFGALALLLAMIGLYGVMSYNMARRRGEIGIRIALGAPQSRVLRLVLGEAGRIAVVGVVLGVAGALAATRLVKSFLFGLAANDPTTIAASALLLLVVAAIAGYLPARRAAALDPVNVLRDQN